MDASIPFLFTSLVLLLLPLSFLIHNLRIKEQQFLNQTTIKKEIIAEIIWDERKTLTSIKRYAELIELDIHSISDDDKEHHLNNISNNLERLVHLLNLAKDSPKLDKKK